MKMIVFGDRAFADFSCGPVDCLGHYDLWDEVYRGLLTGRLGQNPWYPQPYILIYFLNDQTQKSEAIDGNFIPKN